MRPEFSGEMTSCHRCLHRILSELGFQIIDNYKINGTNYAVDCKIEELEIAAEADGKFFHTFKKRDAKRDAIIKEKTGISIIRIPEKLLDRKHDLEVKEIILRNIDNANNNCTLTDKR